MTGHAETILIFSTPYCLSLRNGQMIIHTREAPDQRKSIPIEDIGFVVLEDQQISITLPLLNTLSDNNVAVILCGETRMPNAMLMNLDSNRTQGENYRAQIEASEPLKKGLWKQIIEAKIRNQAALLRKLERDGDKLKPYYMNVKNADADNREGIAAKIYWTELFVDTRFDKIVRPLEVGLTFTTSSMAKCFAGIQKKVTYPMLE